MEAVTRRSGAASKAFASRRPIPPASVCKGGTGCPQRVDKKSLPCDTLISAFSDYFTIAFGTRRSTHSKNLWLRFPFENQKVVW